MNTLQKFVLALCLVASTQLGAEAFKVVAFGDGTYDVAHISFVKESKIFFPALAERKGFEFQYTNNWGNLNDNFLTSVDVVIFLDNHPYNSNDQAAFKRFIERGGGWIGHHVSAFTSEWSWYHNEFLGSGNFKSNTWKPTPAIVVNEMPEHPAMTKTPARFTTAANEWYSWSNNLRNNPNIDVLLSIHPDSFPLGTDPNQSWYSGDYPVVWSNKKYNMVYWNMGHNDIDYSHGNADLSRTWDSPTQVQLVTDCIYWMVYNKQAKERQSFRDHLFGRH